MSWRREEDTFPASDQLLKAEVLATAIAQDL